MDDTPAMSFRQRLSQGQRNAHRRPPPEALMIHALA